MQNNLNSGNKLSSLECADFINWIAFNKYGVALNKTQMQKILYFVYGIYLSTTGKVLFEDDAPKAWPFGPVFPRVNKRYTPGKIPSAESLSIDKIKNDSKAFDIIKHAVEKLYKTTATTLSEWSHEENGPWYKTVYNKDNQEVQWNKEISQNLIKDYFPKFKKENE